MRSSTSFSSTLQFHFLPPPPCLLLTVFPKRSFLPRCVIHPRRGKEKEGRVRVCKCVCDVRALILLGVRWPPAFLAAIERGRRNKRRGTEGKKEAKFFPSLHATKRGEGVHQMFSVLILLFSSSSSPRCMRELFPEEGTKTKADGEGTEIRAV